MATKRHPSMRSGGATDPNSGGRRTAKWAIGIAVAFLAIILLIVALSLFLPPDYANVLG